MLKWGFSNEQETCGRHQADHATPTGLPHDGHCLLSPGHDNGYRHRHQLCQASGGHDLTDKNDDDQYNYGNFSDIRLYH